MTTGTGPAVTEGDGDGDGDGDDRSDGNRSWTFLTNHAHVLLTIAAQPDLRLREIADRVGITERSTVGIITDLERSGYLERRKVGRRNRYALRFDQPLRHPLEAHHNVGELLTAVAHSELG